MNLLSIRPGRQEDLPELHRLLSSSLRSFFYHDMGGAEELDLLKGTHAVLMDQQSDKLRGFVSFESAQRSEALPDSAPTKLSLRATAFSSGGAAARFQFSALFEFARRQLPASPHSYIFFAMTEQRWLQASLKEAGFDQCDAVRFYERKSRAVHPLPQPATLRLAQPADLPPLARLDAAAFDPLWHMGIADLQTLQCDCRFEIAELSTQPVGYSALRLNSDGSPHGHDSAQLVRLAVHPQAQSLGIGRQLLVASLCYAHQLGIVRVFLNTQESNRPSQKLYESHQFRKRGRAVPVLVKEVSQCLA